MAKGLREGTWFGQAALPPIRRCKCSGCDERPDRLWCFDSHEHSREGDAIEISLCPECMKFIKGVEIE